MPTKLTAEILAAAIEGFEAQKRHIDARIAEIRKILNDGRRAPAAAPEALRPRRKLSAAARKRMAEGQRRRWAEAKRQAEPPEPAAPEAAKPKRKISAAGRRAIIAPSKKRWAASRAAKKAATKKTAAKKSLVKAAQRPRAAESAA